MPDDPTPRDRVWTFALSYPKAFTVDVAVDHTGVSERTVRSVLRLMLDQQLVTLMGKNGRKDEYRSILVGTGKHPSLDTP